MYTLLESSSGGLCNICSDFLKDTPIEISAYIWYIGINRIWQEITNEGWYAVKSNQSTKRCLKTMFLSHMILKSPPIQHPYVHIIGIFFIAGLCNICSDFLKDTPIEISAYIWYIGINRIWQEITNKGWYAVKSNQSAKRCLKTMFLSHMILKSPPVQHPYVHIIGIFFRWFLLYQFWFPQRYSHRNISIYLIYRYKQDLARNN